VGKALEESSTGNEMVLAIDGGSAVLETWLMKYDLKIQLGSQSNIKID
jgi:hypothetical protein